jgi:hypothetical protein
VLSTTADKCFLNFCEIIEIVQVSNARSDNQNSQKT